MRAAKTIYNPISGNFDQIDEGIVDLETYLSDLGFLRKGLEIEPNNDLTFNISAGSFKGYVASTDSIQTFDFAARSTASFIILDALTGNPLTDETSIVDPTLIDDGNGNQTLLSGNNKVGLVEFYQTLSGQLYLLYGQIEYTSTNIAKRDYLFENKVKPSILNDAIRIGAFLLRRNTNNLQNVNVIQIPINDRGQLVNASSSEGAEGGLRGEPVANDAELIALVAQDYEKRKVLSTGKEYVFTLGAIAGDLQDAANTGYWIEQGIVGSSEIFQTQIETLSYSSSGAVQSVSYTHNRTQADSGSPAVNFGDLTITRQYIGNGQAYVTIEFQTVYFQDDNNDIIITLPTGTITQPIAPNRRGFRSQLNITAYVLATLGVDQITINRDNNIDNNSPTYFRLNGIGNWIGDRPDAIYLPNNTQVQEWTDFAMNIKGEIADPTKGTTSVDRAQFKVIGKTLFLRYDFEQTGSGTNGNGNYLFELPTGYTPDLPTPSGNLSQFQVVGYAAASDGTTFAHGIARWRAGLNAIDLAVGNPNSFIGIGSSWFSLSSNQTAFSFCATLPIL